MGLWLRFIRLSHLPDKRCLVIPYMVPRASEAPSWKSVAIWYGSSSLIRRLSWMPKNISSRLGPRGPWSCNTTVLGSYTSILSILLVFATTRMIFKVLRSISVARSNFLAVWLRRHTLLCLGQWAFWQVAEQYRKVSASWLPRSGREQAPHCSKASLPHVWHGPSGAIEENWWSLNGCCQPCQQVPGILRKLKLSIVGNWSVLRIESTSSVYKSEYCQATRLKRLAMIELSLLY